MNLHYSQTKRLSKKPLILVLLPYEFTLLSNDEVQHFIRLIVLLPYEFTLLSNLK